MSQPKLQKLRQDYTNNCTLIGELTGQIRALQKRIDAALEQNAAMNEQHAAIVTAMQEQEAAKSKDKESSDGKADSAHQS